MQFELVAAVDLAIFGNLADLDRLAGGARRHEIIVVLERGDVFFGQGIELGLAVGSIAIGVESIERHLGVAVIEGPFDVEPGNEPLLVEDDVGAHDDPDMWMGARRGGNCSRESCQEKRKNRVPSHSSLPAADAGRLQMINH